MSQDVIRVPVDNDPSFRAKVIPGLARRHIKEVGPVPRGADGKESAAALIRWGCAEAAKPRALSAVSSQELEAIHARESVARAAAEEACINERKAVASLRAELAATEALLDAAAACVAGLEARAVDAETARNTSKRYASRLEERIEGLSPRLAAAEVGLAEERGRSAALRDEVAALTAKLADMAARYVPPLDVAAATVANVAAKLKAAREAAGLSQLALARKLGYKHKSSVWLAENGRAPLSQAMRTWLEGRWR